MEFADRYAPRSADVACEDFDGEFVVLDLGSGRYFSLLGGAALVWRGLLSGHSIASLCAALPAGDTRRDGIAALVRRLLDYDLLVVSNPAAEPPPGIPAEVALAEGPFEVEMFDDLADLLLADPIHDVDPDTGWPAMKAAQD
jgi:hypothetical protein